MVPPRWGLVSSVVFKIVPMSYKIKNTWLIFIFRVEIHHNQNYAILVEEKTAIIMFGEPQPWMALYSDSCPLIRS